MTPRLYEVETIVRMRDLAEERYTATGDVEWSTLVEVCEEMLAGERNEREIGSWIEQYNLREELGYEPRRGS